MKLVTGFLFIAFLASVIGAALMVVVMAGCKENPADYKWVKSPGVYVTAEREIIDNKPFLTVFYENFGDDTVEKIRYQLISSTNGKADTELREIDPPVLLRPKDRHVMPHPIGEDTLQAESVRAGQVWVVKNK
ncbi:MAG TPA: hypothetical protein VGM92_01605 [Candidatus Kapabacteria bacterium]|jgi:hypothetical protein